MKEKYTEDDFIILEGLENTHNNDILYTFESKDGEIGANFFWIDGDVQLRYMFYSGYECFRIGYPFAYSYSNKPTKEVILKSFLRCLNEQLKELKLTR